MIRKILLLTYTTLLGLMMGCRDSDAPIPLRAPNLQTPTVRGIFITLEDGPEPVDVWGDPAPNATGQIDCPPDPPIRGTIPTEVSLRPPLPNPLDVEANIIFGTPCSARIKLWVMGADFLDGQGRVVHFANATVVSVGGLAIRTLMDTDGIAGFHRIRWNGRDDLGRIVPDGFTGSTCKLKICYCGRMHCSSTTFSRRLLSYGRSCRFPALLLIPETIRTRSL